MSRVIPYPPGYKFSDKEMKHLKWEMWTWIIGIGSACLLLMSLPILVFLDRL